MLSIKHKTIVLSFVMTVCGLLDTGNINPGPVHAGDQQTIIDLWSDAAVPPRVELKDVSLNAGETAFLVLDIEERT